MIPRLGEKLNSIICKYPKFFFFYSYIFLKDKIFKFISIVNNFKLIGKIVKRKKHIFTIEQKITFFGFFT